MNGYPKRLIEVDLPIKRISAHARREKSIRHGHISTLHIWWARRPLAACRAVICATLWPDPADEFCPQRFRDDAYRVLADLRDRVTTGLLSDDLRVAREPVGRIRVPKKAGDYVGLRQGLLDFIAEFANWDLSTNRFFLETSRALTQSAHESLGGAPGTRPLVVDPFAGGGSIPLEASRVGADAFASDLNPIPFLLNKVVLEYMPKYGQQLADEVRKWGRRIKEQAEKELSAFYPKDLDGATPIAYLWARTIKCEGPGCGAEVPLIRSLWLAKKDNQAIALRIVPRPRAKRVDFEIIERAKASDVSEGIVKRGSATCPCCGFTTPVSSVRTQLKTRKGGAADARLFAVVTEHPDTQGRSYRLPNERDLRAVAKAAKELERQENHHAGPLSLVPDEEFTGVEPRRIPLPQYGINGFRDIFAPRQALTLATLARLVHAFDQVTEVSEPGLALAIQTLLAFAVDRQADYLSSLTVWSGTGEFIAHTFGRQALPIVWEWPECQPFAGGSGNFEGAINWISLVVEQNCFASKSNVDVALCSATEHILPNDIASAVITDPPYYYSIPYSDLSDFFYVWLRRSLGPKKYPELSACLTPKKTEIVQNLPHSEVAHLQKDRAFYEANMRLALQESRRIANPSAVGVVVFAHSETDAWESLLSALIGAGWQVTASWPIDTERAARVLAARQSSLASSVHLVCRPREHPDGSLRTDDIGDWRDVLAELPKQIHEWMPRLATEGVVGADAIFACLGPALEVFSRYSRVEKASGEQVTLREYLEQVWAAVSKEALNMIFTGADATGFEEDARLTAMWLWTLNAGDRPGRRGDSQGSGDSSEEDEAEEDEDGNGGKKTATGGYALEYDAARKIAQGLGAHLEKLTDVVEVKGDTARLLPVSERTRALFGKDQADAPAGKRKKKDTQLKLDFAAELETAEAEGGGWGDKSVSKPGETVLDRLHQTMILFAAGRGEALRRFLVDDGIGRDQRFWRLAQALSALYPANTDEKRWVDGVLARKKGTGF